MAAQILDGKKIAEQLTEIVKKDVAKFEAARSIKPGLTVIIVGENPASKVYVNRKHKACEELGIASEVVRLPETTSEGQLLQEIDRLNGDNRVHGILVQLPLPKHINSELVLERISPLKDVDGFHPVNVGNLTIGKEGLVPCTPYGVIKMLEISGISVEGKRAVVLGRSNIVGKPMTMLLMSRNATVTVCHSRTKDLAAVCREGDILVAAIGKPEFVTKDMVKPGAIVIDVGINRVGDKLVGDVKFDEVKEVAGYITPVPGGVGPLTIGMLLHNTLKAAELQLDK
ncbi:bifunctional methylenetetrahydrofolate dehydrogenase/methenyltetrahydrofolate cyclohydrolase FolD [Anaerospora sp.]|jgi:methylenetetrahydrofolate dehydrogenase (NADP+)/methenyltetrahydrofolate cyclohydrolase|uniref:bifunctional methylenetetrahydrofolate dehydrogenase/methenyltetrahydrofolate cyclohydrolase FolD n=1 Tax=Anaerospora sp. TaxID=1960278 RepID=UPI0028990DF4|nr:bifunctional methylenetetrahydrofolate dehydrogenase/methenyltetrahydrofolate cyclohydrolase FolD [Anaerospora sp.]